MTVRLGSLELAGVQRIHTEEARRIVELGVPGRMGGVLQDLGRPALAVRLEGLFFGENAVESLEALRQAHAGGEPLAFAADVMAGTDLTDVFVEHLEVREDAGYARRYRYRLTLREHIEEPEPEAAEIAAVDAGVEADADAWADGSLGAAGVLDDVTTLPDAVAADPSVLDHLSTEDLTGSLQDAAGGLTGGGLAGIVDAAGGAGGPFGDIAGALKGVEMADLVAAYNAIQDPSKLPELLGRAPGLLERMGAGDLAKGIGDKLNELTGGDLGGVIETLAKVDPQKVVDLVNDLRSAGSFGEFMEKLAGGGVDILKDLTGVDLGIAGSVIKAVAGGADFIQRLTSVADKGSALVDTLRRYDPLAPVRALGEGRQP